MESEKSLIELLALTGSQLRLLLAYTRDFEALGGRGTFTLFITARIRSHRSCPPAQRGGGGDEKLTNGQNMMRSPKMH